MVLRLPKKQGAHRSRGIITKKICVVNPKILHFNSIKIAGVCYNKSL